MSDTSVVATISGRVQGVGFRAWAADEARSRGLAGWIMNHRDGTVEALISGEQAAVDAMVETCRRGPIGARVDSLETRSGPAPQGTGFLILPTD